MTKQTHDSRPEFIFSQPRRGRPTVAVSPALFSVVREYPGDGVLVLKARGRLDLNTVLAFRDAVFGALGERPARLVLDLTGVSAVEPSGISSIVTLARVASLVKVPVDLVPSPAFSALMAQTGLVRLLSLKTPTGVDIAQHFLGSLPEAA